jgi:hypothetical protein
MKFLVLAVLDEAALEAVQASLIGGAVMYQIEDSIITAEPDSGEQTFEKTTQVMAIALRQALLCKMGRTPQGVLNG